MKYWVLFGALAMIWGSSFLLIKIGVKELSALQLVTGRLGITSIAFLLLLAALRKRLPSDPKTLAIMALIGLTNTAIPFTLITWGEQSIDSGLASVLNATVPLFSIIIAHIALADDKITAGKVLGLLTGFVGVVILAARGIDPTHPNPISGQIAVLVAAIFYAISAVIIRRYLRQVEPLVTAGGSMVVGAVVIIAITLLFDRPLPVLAQLSTATILAVVGLALVNTLIANIMYFTIIKAWGASRATMVTYMMPPVGLTLGAIANHEQIEWTLILGAALIIGGVVLANLTTLRRAFAPAAPSATPAPAPVAESVRPAR